MGRRLRFNIFEGEDVIVRIDFLGGNFSAQNAAEKTTGSWVIHSWGENSTGLVAGPRCSQGQTMGLTLAILRNEVGKGLGGYIPCAFERVVQIREHEIGEEQERAGDDDGGQTE